MESIVTVGADVHKDTNSVCMFDWKEGSFFARARNSLKRELKQAKQMLLSFLLRIGRSYPDSGSYWTLKHRNWLETLKFEDRKLNYAYRSYLQQIKDLEAKLALMDDEIENIADEERYKDKVDRLVCFSDVDTQTALTLVVEIGDFGRFATAEQFASYIGLVPGEDSSGQKKRTGSITKEGNSRVRVVLTEAAKAIKRSSPYHKSKRILERQKGQSPEIIAYADRGSKRIRQKEIITEIYS